MHACMHACMYVCIYIYAYDVTYTYNSTAYENILKLDNRLITLAVLEGAGDCAHTKSLQIQPFPTAAGGRGSKGFGT